MFKTINVFDGRFKVNECGVVFNSVERTYIRHHIGKNNGYAYVDLYYKGKKKRFTVHRLVATAFCDNPMNLPVVMHLDSNRTNNLYTNLKWGSYRENNIQAIREGHMKVPIPDNRKYYEIYNDKDSVVVYGIKEAQKLLSMTESCIRNYIFRNTNIPNGKYKAYKIKKIDVQRSSPDGRVEP